MHLTFTLPLPQIDTFVRNAVLFVNSLVESNDTPMPTWVLRVAPLAHASLQQLLPVQDTALKARFSLYTVVQSIYRSYHTTDAMEEGVRLMPQRSPLWYKIRNGWSDPDKLIFRAPLISSSLCGMVLQHKKDYTSSHVKLLKEQVWFDARDDPSKPMDAFAIRALQRGTAMEPTIMESTRCIIQAECQAAFPKCYVQIQEVGLHICLDDPWMAASPDGIVTCYDPDSGTLYRSGDEMKCCANNPSEPYRVNKPEYYDQCQHTMALLGFDEYVFVCHATESFGFETYTFDAEAWARHYEYIKMYYWKKLWPRVVLRALGLLDDEDTTSPNEPPVVGGSEDDTQACFVHDNEGAVQSSAIAAPDRFVPASERRIHPHVRKWFAPMKGMASHTYDRWMQHLTAACCPKTLDENGNPKPKRRGGGGRKRASPTSADALRDVQ